MKKRNYIEEITSIKERSEFQGRFELMNRLFAIDSVINSISKNDSRKNNEILRYIPIATIACFESFFRSIVAELIDKGKPYSQNVLKFNQSKNINFDFNIVNAIQKKKISVGDFVSHILSCNNLKDFNSNLSILTNTKFINELKTFEPKQPVQSIIDTSKIFRNKTSIILESVEKTFELRHIFCHEFATTIELDYRYIKGIYEHCKIFLFHVNDYIWHLIEPNAPLSQLEMNLSAKREYEEVNSLIEKLVKELKTIEIGRDNALDKIMNKWKEYRDLKADFEASSYEGGTIRALIHYKNLTFITKNKIKELQEEIKIKKKNIY